MLSDKDQLRSRMRAHQRVAQDMMAKLSAIEQICFVAMRGSAYGAGVAIAMTGDFRIMADDIVINLPETNLSMFLTFGSTPLLVNAVGLARAKEMILFAEDCTAQQCLELGVAQRVVPEGEVLRSIHAMIATLRQRDWRAVRIAKQVANASVAPQFGNMIMTEPELVAGSIADGTIHSKLDRFLNRKK
jgi:enoyl-CoA hydratase/carnithine racemase